MFKLNHKVTRTMSLTSGPKRLMTFTQLSPPDSLWGNATKVNLDLEKCFYSGIGDKLVMKSTKRIIPS